MTPQKKLKIVYGEIKRWDAPTNRWHHVSDPTPWGVGIPCGHYLINGVPTTITPDDARWSPPPCAPHPRVTLVPTGDREPLEIGPPPPIHRKGFIPDDYL